MWLGTDATTPTRRRAPAIHLLPKTIYGPLDEARAVTQAARAVRGTGELAPIWYGRRVLGSVYGHRSGRRVSYYPKIDALQLMGFPNGYTDVVKAIRTGQTYSSAVLLDSSSSSGHAFAWADCWTLQAGSAANAYSGTALTARQFTDTSLGGIYTGGNVSPATKHLTYINLTGNNSTRAVGSTFWLYDRVLSYDECTITNVTQTMTNSLTAQRWVGAGLPGLRVTVTISKTGTGATASHWTSIIYANEATTGGSNVPLTSQIDVLTNDGAGSGVALSEVIALDATAGLISQLGPFLPLQASDIGVSSVTSYVQSAANTGTTCYVLLRPLAIVVSPGKNVTTQQDLVRERLSLARIYDGACLSFLLFSADIGAFTCTINSAWGQ